MNQSQGKGAEGWGKHQGKENVAKTEDAVTRSCAQFADNEEVAEGIWSKQLCQPGDLCLWYSIHVFTFPV